MSEYTSQIEDLEVLCKGLEENIKQNRGNIDLFTKAQGLLEEEEKLRAEASRVEDDIKKEKETKDQLQGQKNKAMMSALSPMIAKMDEALPSGKADIQIYDDGSLFIGWKSEGRIISTPYAGLSGGEKAVFDPALCKALGCDALIVEAGEIDSDHLSAALDLYAKSDIQVIVSSWHMPTTVPDGWKVVRL